MNKIFILDKVNPFLNSEKNISKETFKNLFVGFDRMELLEVVKILKDSNINIDLDDKKSTTSKPVKVKKSNKGYQLDKLTNEQLCIMYKRGEFGVLDALMKKNDKLVWSRVVKYRGFFKHKLDDEDLLQYGFMGFLKAIEKFDIQKENKLTTYAIWWIDQNILRSIADYGFTVRLPVHVLDSVLKLTKIKRNHMDATKEELYVLAETEGIRREKFDELMKIMNNILSLSSINAIIGEDEESEVGDFIEDKSAITVEEQVEAMHLQEVIQSLLSTLKPREEEVIKLRFGLEDGKERTLEEVGHGFNVTRERIRQIEVKALNRLRHSSRSKKLRDFIK